MTGHDLPPFRPRPHDLIMALALLTRLPMPAAAFPQDQARPAVHAAWAYPLVGGVVALCAALIAGAATSFGLPAPMAAGLVLLTSAVITGAMHEDGLADCADGFWGGWTKERRLEIMKDSQIGTYGVIALVLALGLRWLALAALLATGNLLLALLCAAILSRVAMVGVMYALPAARLSGLSGSTGRPPQYALALATGFGLLAAAATLPMAVVTAALAALCAALIAKAKIGGQTGDVLGATQQLSEIAVLLTFVAMLP